MLKKRPIQQVFPFCHTKHFFIISSDKLDCSILHFLMFINEFLCVGVQADARIVEYYAADMCKIQLLSEFLWQATEDTFQKTQCSYCLVPNMSAVSVAPQISSDKYT